MAFSMVLSCIVDAIESEIAAAKKREDKLAEKPKETATENGEEAKGPDTKSPMTELEIEEAAFRKFWDTSAEWVKKLAVDIAAYAKDNDARDHDTLMELLHKKEAGVDQEDVKILFARNIWAPLRSRGWKATGLDGSSTEQQYSFGDEKVSHCFVGLFDFCAAALPFFFLDSTPRLRKFWLRHANVTASLRR